MRRMQTFSEQLSVKTMKTLCNAKTILIQINHRFLQLIKASLKGKYDFVKWRLIPMKYATFIWDKIDNKTLMSNEQILFPELLQTHQTCHGWQWRRANNRQFLDDHSLHIYSIMKVHNGYKFGWVKYDIVKHLTFFDGFRFGLQSQKSSHPKSYLWIFTSVCLLS